MEDKPCTPSEGPYGGQLKLWQDVVPKVPSYHFLKLFPVSV